MKISIDARGVNLYKGSGIGTYIENLLRELLNIDKKNTYSIFWAGENYNEFKKLERHSKKGIITFKAGKRPKHENEDPIRSGIEAMEICNFPCCNRTAKIKPLLKMTGAYCSFCGVKNYEIE